MQVCLKRVGLLGVAPVWCAWRRTRRSKPWVLVRGLAFETKDLAVAWACKTFNVDVSAEDPHDPPAFVLLEE